MRIRLPAQPVRARTRVRAQTNILRIQMTTVDTVWPFQTSTGKRVFTNHTASNFGPDNREASSL